MPLIDSRQKTLIAQGDELFSKRLPLLSLWQEMADNFYPQRADFTVTRTIGQDFASNLSTSFPLIAHRDLGGIFGAMLRPSDRVWAYMGVEHMDEDDLDDADRLWLESRTNIMRRAMYDRRSQFKKATKECDNDFAAFGQGVIQVMLNGTRDGLLYRTHHLRDVAWTEKADGTIGNIHRKWTPYACDLIQLFDHDNRDGRDVSMKLKELYTKEPYAKVECRHIVVSAEQYESMDRAIIRRGFPYYSLYIDIQHGWVMEETPLTNQMYVIPRWQTVSGSQYAYSPATVAALPDARLIQSMTLTLLEAGEKAVNPPLVATEQAVRSDMAIYAGGVTWIDAEYDERMGDAVRPLGLDFRGLPYGDKMANDIKASIVEAFYLNKITMPPSEREMTAYETAQRVEEYIRNAMPLFEPLEDEYNGALCEITSDIMLRNGGFGPIDQIPEGIRGKNLAFRFISPLSEAIERRKVNAFMEGKGVLLEAAQMDPSVGTMVDIKKATRQTLETIIPQEWIVPEEQVAAADAAAAQQMQGQELLATLNSAGVAAQNLGKGAQALTQPANPTMPNAAMTPAG